MKWIAALFLALVLASPAMSAPDGKPRTVQMLGRWRIHDPALLRRNTEAWTPSDVAGLLALYPDARMDLGVFDAYPPGNLHWRRTGGYVRETRAIAESRGISTGRRLCLTERPDIIFKSLPNVSHCASSRGGGGCDWEGNMDGRFGEEETVVKVAGRASAGDDSVLADSSARWVPGQWDHRLLVLRPDLPGEERRRIVNSYEHAVAVDEPWTTPPQLGDPYEIRGSFDPAWVRRVSGPIHAATVRRFWTDNRNVCAPLQRCKGPAEPLDPFAALNRRSWPESTDRQAYEALREGGRVPALYGSVRDWGKAPHLEDPYFRVSALVADVGNAAYRRWRLRHLLYKLQDHGFEPGDPVCVAITYKPGWHTYHDGENSDAPCSVPGINQWSGPAHVCTPGRKVDGLFHPTTYGPREFETGINAYFRELFQTLEANGYGNADVLTTEGPRYTNRLWTILADDVRRHPKLVGERGGWMKPPLAVLDRAGLRNLSESRPAGARPSPPGGPPAGADEQTPAPTPPAPTAPTAPDGPGASPGGGSNWSVRSAPASEPSGRSGGRRIRSSSGAADGTVEAPSLR